MQAWLDARGLSPDVFNDYILRDLLKRNSRACRAEVLAGVTCDDDAVHAALAVDLLCEGRLLSLARPLAARAAVERHAREALGPDKPTPHAPADAPIADAFPGLSKRATQEKLVHLSMLDAVWERFHREAMSDGPTASHLRSRGVDWVRVDLRIATFSDENAAREALLCVRDDGMDLAEVGKQAGARMASSRPILRDIEGPVRDRLLAATKGEFVGPIVEGKNYLVVELRDKILPAADDAELAARVKKHLVEALVAREVEGKIRWLGPLA